MEPQYRFCTSIDGTRIAYATYGSGPPLLFANTWVLSMDSQFTWPEARLFFDALAAQATVVLFDRRGTGASARDVDDISPEAEAHDIAAVADAAKLDYFPLFADATAGAACASFAIAYAKRLKRLILWHPTASNAVISRDKEWAESIRRDWSYDRRLWASRIYPDGPVSLQRSFSLAIKNTIDAEMAARRVESHPELERLLPQVKPPTLVLLRETWTGPVRQFGIQVAGRLPLGELRFVAGDAATSYPQHGPVAAAILDFFGIKGLGDSVTPSGMTAILFADIADSTALTERLGDAAFRAKARELGGALRALVRECSGTPVEGPTLGDGVLAVFTSARGAIEAARRCAKAGDDAGLPLHLGLHAGDVTPEKDPDGRDNVYGGAVNIASRISGLSAPGEVLVSETVRSIARTSAGVVFEDRGEQALKGVGEPVRVWAVLERG